MTSAIFDVFQILQAKSDVIQNFRNFFENSFRIVNLYHQSKFGVDCLYRTEVSAFFDNDIIETVFVKCFFHQFHNVKISFWPIF